MEDSETKQYKDHLYKVLQNPQLQIIYTIANENHSIATSKFHLLQQLSGVPVIKTQFKSSTDQKIQDSSKQMED